MSLSCKKLRVIKRDGREEPVDFEKITRRIEKLCFGLCANSINVTVLAQNVIHNLVDMIEVTKIDDLAAMKAAACSIDHPDYNLLAGRICASNIQKNTCDTFYEAMKKLYDSNIVDDNTWSFIDKNKDVLNKAIHKERDMIIEYFGIQTLKKSYLLKVNKKIVETPQYMYMRVACGINYNETVEEAIEMYENLSKGYYIHSSPTLFNSGTIRPQLASCFLIDMKDDSIDGIFDTVKVAAKISKYAGGIGFNIHDVRCNGSYIKGTNGYSQGIVPWLKIFNDTSVAVNQAGRRKGSFAAYLEVHHADFMDFMDIRKPEKAEDMRAKDLFTAVWISDIFMRRVISKGDWTFFDPNTNDDTRRLSRVYDEEDNAEYSMLYEKLEASGVGIDTVKAIDVWRAIISSLFKTGTPYIVNKDVVNRKSNQKNVGVIRSSNLCSEIVEYTSPDETAVCTLCSINLSKFVDIENRTMYYNKIADMASKAVVYLNKTIDYGFYPTECSRRSHFRHRPLGLGVSGLQDVFFILDIPFNSEKARVINRRIFESIYYGAVRSSCELAKVHGHYETFPGSPASKGILNYDMWNTKPDDELGFEWDQLKENIKTNGLRNSLHVALMPTATSASILGVTECFEPVKFNAYKRKTLSGEFTIINKYLVRKLTELKLWNENVMEHILAENGSIQNMEFIPEKVREVFKTAYEHKTIDIIDMAADRNPWVDQSQSMNLYSFNLGSRGLQKLSTMLIYSWKKEMKTMIYYLRLARKENGIKFTVNNKSTDENDDESDNHEQEECLECQA